MVRRREPLVTGCLHSDPVDVLDDLVEELGRDGSGAVMDRDVAESAAVVGVVGGHEGKSFWIWVTRSAVVSMSPAAEPVSATVISASSSCRTMSWRYSAVRSTGVASMGAVLGRTSCRQASNGPCFLPCRHGEMPSA